MALTRLEVEDESIEMSELSSLVPLPTKSPQFCDNKKLGMLAQGAFGLICASGSSLLFLKPCQDYASNTSFGQALSAWIHGPSWPLFWVSSVLDFGGTSLYLAGKSVPAYIEFIKKQPQLSSKILKGSGLLLLTATQNIQPILITTGTHAPVLIIAAATISDFPRNLYSTMNLIGTEIPAIYEQIKKWILPLQVHLCPSHFISPEERAAKAFLYQISQIQSEFFYRIQAGWQNSLSQSKRRVSGEATDLEIWLNMTDDLPDAYFAKETKLSRSIRILMQVCGIIGATNILLPIWLNAQKQFLKFLLPILFPSMVNISSWILTAMSSLSATYFFNKFMIVGFEEIHDTLKNIAQNKPLDWMAFHLRPKIMIASILVSTLISLLSYPTVLNLFNENYTAHAKDELAYSLIVFINLNHIIGLVKLSNFAVLSYTKNFSSLPEDGILHKMNEARMAAEKLSKTANVQDFLHVMSICDNQAKNKLLSSSLENKLNNLLQNNPHSFFQQTAKPTYDINGDAEELNENIKNNWKCCNII